MPELAYSVSLAPGRTALAEERRERMFPKCYALRKGVIGWKKWGGGEGGAVCRSTNGYIS